MILCLVGLKTHLFHLNLNRTSDQDRPVREGSSLTLSRMLADADADADAGRYIANKLYFFANKSFFGVNKVINKNLFTRQKWPVCKSFSCVGKLF